MKTRNSKGAILVVILIMISIIGGYLLTSNLRNYTKPTDNNLQNNSNFDRSKQTDYYKEFSRRKVNQLYQNIEDVKSSCEKMEKTGYCLYWASFYTGIKSVPDYEEAKGKCLKIGKEHMGACFDGFGNGLAQKYKNASRASSICQKVSSKYRKSCYDGVSGGLGGIFFDNIPKAVKNCNALNKDVRVRCYDGLGHGLSSNYYKFPDKMFKGCMGVPEKYRAICFKGMGFNMGLDHPQELERDISICKGFKNYSEDCIIGVGKSIGEFMSYKNTTKGEEKCLEFDQFKFKKNCIEEMGFGIGRNYIENMEEGIKKCKNLQENLTLHCLRGFKKTITRRYGNGEKFKNKCQKLGEENKQIKC